MSRVSPACSSSQAAQFTAPRAPWCGVHSAVPGKCAEPVWAGPGPAVPDQVPLGTPLPLPHPSPYRRCAQPLAPPPLPGALIPFSAPLVLTSFLQAHRCPPCPLGPRAPSRHPVPSSPSRSSSSKWDTGSPGQPVPQGQGGSEGHTDSTPKCLCSPEPRRPDGWVQHDVGHRGQRLGGLICCRRCSVLVSGTSMESD